MKTSNKPQYEIDSEMLNRGYDRAKSLKKTKNATKYWKSGNYLDIVVIQRIK